MQVELRVLAHLSGDAALVRLLQQAGPCGDAFKHIAHSWLGAGGYNCVHKGLWSGRGGLLHRGGAQHRAWLLAVIPLAACKLERG